ncbi:asialoglycoprotein receptor 1-like [Eublepharis macularius]|uniref:Asialoglycoprotein receptor 1-like n=1 Tax=Eublepharis macularius TaxID=481883 RepID=A0AA97K9R7_EUBMA|nr:asialoglycoprotein receptor 1-like [Eublepharis macularius]
MATSFVNSSASEPEPMVSQDYQDFKSLDEADEGGKPLGRAPHSAWQRICPTNRLLLLLMGLCIVLSILVLTLGIKGAQLGTDQQQTWESLRSFNKTISVGLTSVRRKRNSTGSKLATLEQTLSRESNETERVKIRLESLLQILEQDSNTLRCQVVEVKSNGSKSGCCPKGWVVNQKSCYWMSHSQRSWPEAKRDCEGKDSHLVIINSPDERQFVNERRRSAFMWIGLTDSSGSWKWVDGTGYTVQAEDWGEGQPDHWYGHGLGGGEDCVHTFPDGLWNDNHCSRSFAWMCEQELRV